MNVCLLNDSFPPVIDGVANVVLNYAQIMQETIGANVCVGTPKYPNADYTLYPYKVVPYSSLDTTKIVKGYRAGNPFDLIELKEMNDFNPDIIHTHCPVASAMVSRMLKVSTGAPTIFTYHTKFDEDIARAVSSDFIRKETVRFLVNNIEACDEIWVVSEGAGENLKSLGYEGDYRVMSNGVDFAKGRVDADTVAKVTGSYDLPDGVPVFLFVGRIISYKGIPIILDALKKLSDDGYDYRCVFVGSGPDEAIMKEKANSLGLYDANNNTGKCIFTGPIYDREVLRAFNTRADLFLFLSTYDTNGLVVREAAACGLASVLVKGSCAAEGITDGRNGFLIDQNAESLYELLKKLAGDLDYVHQVGMRSMDEIYISWESSVRCAYRRYEEVIELSKSGVFDHKRSTIHDHLSDFSEDIIRDSQKFFEWSSNQADELIGNMLEDANRIKESIAKGLEETRSDIKQKTDDFTVKIHELKGKLLDE